MKNIALIVVLLTSSMLFGQHSAPLDSSIWKFNYEEALNESKIRGLPLIIVFSGSDRCSPCIKLQKNVLVTDSFAIWAKDSAILLSIDFPRQKKNALPPAQVKHNERIAEKYNINGIFPLIIILSGDEKIIGELIYHDESPRQFINNLVKLIKTIKA